jgi:GT2 family glycosyltransferase
VDVLTTCVTSILHKTSYSNYEILVIDNKSTDPATFEYYRSFQAFSKQVIVHPYNGEFNFSAITNYGVQKSDGEIVLLLNNDTEVLSGDWLDEMVSHCMRKEIGAVGAKLFYPNGQIQHAGVILSGGHPGIHIYLKKQKDDPGYFNKLNLVQNYSAVTAACLAVRKELYYEVGGLDEKNLRVAYNDVDFCLKLREAGYKNLWTPFAKLIHYESLSRGSDMTEVNLPRFKQEQAFMRAKWKNALVCDPYFSPNLSYDTGVTQYAFPPAIRYEWDEAVLLMKPV